MSVVKHFCKIYVHLFGYRYALVIFGGDDIFDSPHSVVIHGNVFTNSTFFSKYFEKFPTGNSKKAQTVTVKNKENIDQ